MKTLWPSVLLALLAIVCPGSMNAADYLPGSGWQEFTFSSLITPYLNDQEPFTFSVQAHQQPILHVADLDSGTERYRVSFSGSSTPFITPEGGAGQWGLAPGSYSIKFWLQQWWIYSPKPIRGRFRVEILPAPMMPTTSPREQVGCIGREVLFKAAAKPAEPHDEPFPDFDYQWLFNGTNVLTGETNSRLNLINLTFANEGFYSCVISNQFGSVTSPPSFLRVLDACTGIHLYAGLSVTGIVGRTYFVEYVTNATETNWTGYATNTLASPVWLFIDTNTPVEPKKFFRVRLQP